MDRERTVTPIATVGWVLVVAAVAALFAGGYVWTSLDRGLPMFMPSFTGSVAWMVTAPLAAAAVLGIAFMNLRRGQVALAAWFAASALSIAIYHAAGELCGWLERSGNTDSVWFTVSGTFGIAGWTMVLGVLQASAIIAARAALRERFGTGILAFIVGSMVVLLIPYLLASSADTAAQFPDMPMLLPVDIALSPVMQGLLSVLGPAWMIGLVAVPVVLWITVARASGIRRQILARIAVGALLPALVVMLCGVLALLATGIVDQTFELAGLAVGFGIAAPVTALWLTATVNEATATTGFALTSLAQVAGGLLWIFYGMGVIQVGGWISEGTGATTGRAIIVTTLVAAATAAPWFLLVRWAMRRVDPRRSLAALIVAKEGDASVVRPAELAQRALREAMSDPIAQVVIARPGGGWLGVEGAPVEIPVETRDASFVVVEDRAGREMGGLMHHTRFIDVRALLGVVRPLLERAALEHELRDRTERLETERRRADAAADEARHRIERDLHDGVQGRLVSLGLGLSLARSDVDDPVTRLLLDDAVLSLHTAVLELRELSVGTLSQSLTTKGLASAVGDLVRRMPIDIELRLDPVALHPDTEAVAYFVIAEGVTNAVKHAGASGVRVDVAQASKSVTITVTDEGPGGADARAGSGLRGLSERVHSVGGRLVVSDREPTGTRLEAVLPCAS